jgi:hypothetical protein
MIIHYESLIHIVKLNVFQDQSLARVSLAGFRAAHPLSRQTEDRDGRDEEHEIVELECNEWVRVLLSNDRRVYSSYSISGIFILLHLCPCFNEEAAKVGKICLRC